MPEHRVRDLRTNTLRSRIRGRVSHRFPRTDYVVTEHTPLASRGHLTTSPVLAYGAPRFVVFREPAEGTFRPRSDSGSTSKSTRRKVASSGSSWRSMQSRRALLII